MVEVTSRRMECTLLTSNYSQMPAVALQLFVKTKKKNMHILLTSKDAKRNFASRRINRLQVQVR